MAHFINRTEMNLLGDAFAIKPIKPLLLLLLLSITIFIFFSARERAEFNKSFNLIGSWSGWSFLIRTATACGIRRVDLFS